MLTGSISMIVMFILCEVGLCYTISQMIKQKYPKRIIVTSIILTVIVTALVGQEYFSNLVEVCK